MSNASSEPNPWYSTVGALAVFFGAQIVAVLMISLYPLLRGWSHSRAEGWLADNLVAQLAYLLLANLLIFAAVYLWLKHRPGGWRGIGWRRPKRNDLLMALAALPVYIFIFALVVGVIKYFVPSLDVNQAQNLGFNGTYSGGQLVAIAVALVVLPPLAEETVFRGLIYTSLRQRLKFAAAAIITSLLFAVGHLPEGGSGGLLYIAAIDTFVLSLVLVYLREKTGGLWAPVGLHALKNGIAFISLFLLHVR